MKQSESSSRKNSNLVVPSGQLSPSLEDLHRFPSESLHSFSFAHQSEDFLHSRQNILKRSIDFMRDRLGWAASSAGIANAQARVSGDEEIQSMMELLARANILGKDVSQLQGMGLSSGPLTGPADVDGANIFEKSFTQQSEGPDVIQESEEPVDGVAEDRTPDLGILLSPGLEEQAPNEMRYLRSAPGSRRASLKRTYTDLTTISLQTKLMETLAQPYAANDQLSASQLLSPAGMPSFGPKSPLLPNTAGPAVHTHSSKWAPAPQAVFRTEGKSPWTILAANDLACLVFGVTRAEVRKLGILEVVQEERRQWLEEKLRGPDPQPEENARSSFSNAQGSGASASKVGNGITAKLLSKTPSREQPSRPSRRAQTDDGSGSSYTKKQNPKRDLNHPPTKSRGVLLCGDVVPIQKRNGATGSASFWVMEKRGGLIWVLEEITENVAYLRLDGEGFLVDAKGDIDSIWGQEKVKPGVSITNLLPRIPMECLASGDEMSFSKIADIRHFTARTSGGINIPTTTTQVSGPRDLRISSFPHIAGIMVLSSSTLTITSSNSVFSAALFGQEQPDGLPIMDLIPGFDDFLRVLTEEDNVQLVDGLVIPEHSFRRARALLALREGKANAAAIFLRPTGLPAKHRDGSDIMVDVQMRVVRSESLFLGHHEDAVEERGRNDNPKGSGVAVTEVVYALWITYSRQLHSASLTSAHPLISVPGTPHQPSPGQRVTSASPEPMDVVSPSSEDSSQVSLLSQQIKEATSQPISDEPLEHLPPNKLAAARKGPQPKKTISDFVILEEMGQGAYGQVKLARYKKNGSNKVVLKYVTKRRILVDTWTRDRRLGTVPLEIHVLDYLRRDGLKHPNIVEMVDFFEDDINYYIEMVPHGIPGMDLFDYIELRSNMEEGECKSIFRQVVDAIHHLHTKALVVHRDIKDENVTLDGEGRIKLIDFGSAAYIKNGPFDVFVGTIGKHLACALK